MREISEVLNIAKSTVSLWSKGVEISNKGELRLEKLAEKFRFRAKVAKERKKIKYLSIISRNCTVLRVKNIFSKDELKIFLALLFWGEGSKKDRRLIFMNSDPEMIKAYLYLLRNSFKINKDKLRVVLHLHGYHNKKKQVDYWSKIAKIDKKYFTIYNKPNSGKRRRDDYQGCVSVRYGDVRILDEIHLIVRRFKKFINAGVG